MSRKKAPASPVDKALAAPENSDQAHIAKQRALVAHARAERVPLQALTKPEQKGKVG